MFKRFIIRTLITIVAFVGVSFLNEGLATLVLIAGIIWVIVGFFD